MTLDVYSGLFDDDLDAVAERLSDAASFSHVPVMRPAATITSITERALSALTCQFGEPPKGIEPLTYALRVRRSVRLS